VDKDIYSALRGPLPARPLALFKIRDYTKQVTVYHLAAVQYMSVVNQGYPSDVHGLVTVHLSDFTQEFTIVDIGMILSLAHLMPGTDRHWLMNNHIDPRTFPRSIESTHPRVEDGQGDVLIDTDVDV